MECQVCNVRSVAAFCSECQVLLCDECGVQCEGCAKVFCPSHLGRTHRGRLLCGQCREVPAAEPTRRLGLFGDGDEIATVAAAADEARQARVRAAMARSRRRPWRVSTFLGTVSGFLAILLLLVPVLRTVPLPDGTRLPTAYFAVVPALLAAAVALAGFLERLPHEHRAWNLLGLAVALVAIGLSLMAVRLSGTELEAVRTAEEELDPGPATPEDRLERRRRILERYEREGQGSPQMTPEERQEWRRKMLDRYKQR